MSVSEVGSRRRGVWQLGVDVRVRSRAERSWRVVGSEVLLPARVSRRRAALRVRLGAGGEPQHDSGGAAAVQSDAVLLGAFAHTRRPRSHATPACSADSSVRRRGRATTDNSAGYHEPHAAFTTRNRITRRHLRLLGRAGNLSIEKTLKKHESSFISRGLTVFVFQCKTPKDPYQTINRD